MVTLIFMMLKYCSVDAIKISLPVISGRLSAGNVLIFPQTVVGAGYRKVRVM